MAHTRPPELIDRAAAAWPPGPVCVALSGGLDSTALLHACAGSAAIRARGLSAIHVDHGLHADSASWAERCAALCASLDVALITRRVEVGSTNRSGLEAAARRARYAAIEATLPAGTIVALAHHADDQAETLLLRLLRGAGVGGLRAMRPLRRLGALRLARPWLELPRAQIAGYARAHALAWIDDPANESLAHDRNYLRHRVMPLLDARWPGAATRFATSAALAGEAARIVARETARALAECRGLDPATLRIEPLRALSPFERAEVVRAWLDGVPSRAVAAIDAMLDLRADAAPKAAWPGMEVRRYRDLLYAFAPPPRIDPSWRAAWDGAAPLATPAGTLALAPGAPLALEVRFRAGGERIALAANRPSQSLKHVLQDLGVPPWERARLPLVFADGELLAAGDLVRSHRLNRTIAFDRAKSVS